MTQDLDTLRGQLIAAIESAASLDALEAVRVEALGKQGSVTTLLKTLGKMSPEERQVEGPKIHSLREAVTERGLVVVDSASDEPAAVVQGHSPDTGWRQLAEAVAANAEQSAKLAESESDVVKEFVDKGELKVVAATYDLVTRKVTFA